MSPPADARNYMPKYAIKTYQILHGVTKNPARGVISDADLPKALEKDLSCINREVNGIKSALDLISGKNPQQVIRSQGYFATVSEKLGSLLTHLKTISSTIATRLPDETVRGPLRDRVEAFRAEAQSLDAALQHEQNLLVAISASLGVQIGEEAAAIGIGANETASSDGDGNAHPPVAAAAAAKRELSGGSDNSGVAAATNRAKRQRAQHGAAAAQYQPDAHHPSAHTAYSTTHNTYHTTHNTYNTTYNTYNTTYNTYHQGSSAPANQDDRKPSPVQQTSQASQAQAGSTASNAGGEDATFNWDDDLWSNLGVDPKKYDPKNYPGI